MNADPMALGVVLPFRAESVEERTCRACGCTAMRACAGGCRWVERDLCSACTAPRDRAEQLALLDRELGARKVHQAIEFAREVHADLHGESLQRLVYFDTAECSVVGVQNISFYKGAIHGDITAEVPVEQLDALIAGLETIREAVRSAKGGR